MTVLEVAVANLATALEQLETKLEAGESAKSADSEDIDAARRQARAARGHAADATRGLSKSISELKALLDENKPDSGA